MIAVSPDRYTAFMLRHRWLVLASAVAVMLVLTAGLQFITISNDWRDMLDEDNPQLVAFDTLEDTYTATNAAVVAVAPKGGSVFTREALDAIEELTEAAWRVPSSTRVDSLTNYTHTESVEDDLRVERLVDDAGSLSDDDLARIERIALGEPSVAGRLVSHDGRVAGLVISFALPEHSDAAEIRILNYLRGLLDEARAVHPDIAYHVTGNVFVNRVLTEAAQDDMGILAPAAFLVIVSVAAILLRSLLGTLSLVVVLIFVVSSTMGVIGWTGLVLNAANSGVPLIIMTLAIAHSAHVVEKIMSGMSQGLDRDTAVALVAGVPRVELTDNWTKHLDERYEFRRDTDFVIENLTGVETLEYSLRAGREGGIIDPDYLRKVDALADWSRPSRKWRTSGRFQTS